MRTIDKSGELPGVMLNFANGLKRRVFFFSFDQMVKAIEVILLLQGFLDRADQYEKVCDLSQGLICTRSIVRHKITGQKFQMRSLDTRATDSDSLGIFENERQARQSIVDERHVETLVDVFSANDKHHMVVTHTEFTCCLELAMEKHRRPDMEDSKGLLYFAYETIAKVCATLRRLEEQGVMLRLIKAD